MCLRAACILVFHNSCLIAGFNFDERFNVTLIQPAIHAFPKLCDLSVNYSTFLQRKALLNEFYELQLAAHSTAHPSFSVALRWLTQDRKLGTFLLSVASALLESKISKTVSAFAKQQLKA